MPASGHEPFWLGGVAASMAASVTHPLDLAKVRMQTSPSSKAGLDLSLNESRQRATPSMIQVLTSTVRQNGWRSLYTGLSAALLRQMTYSLVRLGSYASIKNWISSGQTPSGLQLLLASGVSGALGGIIGNPSDIVLVRMMSESVKPPSARHYYANAIDGIVKLFHEEGLAGLGRGLAANVTRAVLMNISQLASYDYIKSYLLSNSIPVIDIQLRDGFMLHVIASGFAGLVATTITSPADVVRSRMMSNSSNSSVTKVIVRSFQEEGFGVFFKGWTPAFIRLAPNSMLLFIFLEQLRQLWGGSQS